MLNRAFQITWLVGLVAVIGSVAVAQEKKEPKDPDKIQYTEVTKRDDSAMYRVNLNYLKLKNPKDGKELLKQTEKVIEKLKKSDGAIQFALFARPEKGEFWTLSIWKDKASMTAFARSAEHRAAIKAMMELIDSTDNDHWDETGSKLPTKWSEIIKR